MAIQLGGIVVLPKNIQQIVVGYFGAVVLDFDRFGVSGAIAANVFVGGIIQFAAGVTHAGGNYAVNLAKRRFHAPETSCRKCRFGHGSLPREFISLMSAD